MTAMTRSFRRAAALAPALALFLLLCVPAAEAQYFGRNKVQWKTFDFKIIRTEHFDVYYYPVMQRAAAQSARMAERWYARLSRLLNHQLTGRQILILYAAAPDFQQTTAIPGIIGEGVGGVTESIQRRIILPLAPSLAETDHVIGHELVHAFQYDITGQYHSSVISGAPAAARLPLWYVEGMAEYFSIGPESAHTAMWMRDVVRKDDIPTIRQLTNPNYFPYRYGHSVWAYVGGRFGDEAIARIMKGVGRANDYEAVIQGVLKTPIKDLSEGWQASLERKYRPLIERTDLTLPGSDLLIEGTETARLNVAPSLSPDGRWLVFLSTRDLFSVDVYLADALTGKVRRRLIGTAVDPHFESLAFTKSSGTWSQDGRSFLLAGINQGRPVVSIYDVERGTREREFEFPEIGEILNPCFSPDGRSIAFSALAGGVTDLYLFDLEREDLRKLTDDLYADLQPSWSPDGRSIAFTTERFTTDLASLDIGHLELAVYDVESGGVRRVGGFEGAKNIDPHWTPDSGSLYFVSDPNGISNIYRKDLGSGAIARLSDLYTGTSGITDLSPAISVAADSGDVVYTLYADDKYALYRLPNTAVAEIGNGNGNGFLAGYAAAVLPPREKPQGAVENLLENPYLGLPQDAEFPVEDYDSKLRLNYIAPPQLAVGMDRFGTYGAGGLALVFSDTLGYHNLVTAAQVSTRLIDSAALVSYQVTKSRMNWGLAASRVPYVSAGYSQFLGSLGGEPVVINEEVIFRQINYQITGLAAYPFSQFQRLEFAAGYNLLDFNQELRTTAFSLIDGTQLLDDTTDLPSADSLHFAVGSAALVYDSSFFGATAPLLGQRYRLEAQPYFGTITFVNALADFRRYFMPVRPFTLAFRIMHFGRYGGGAEDERLFPLFIGYQELVRGYNLNSLEPGECTTDDCMVFNQLFGSKILVLNAELRFPLFNVLGIGEGFYGVLPIDVVGFFDAGVAWTEADEAFFLGGDRDLVSSAGVGLRLNLFGYAIIGGNLVKPFDRPDKGWYFQFTFAPGF